MPELFGYVAKATHTADKLCVSTSPQSVEDIAAGMACPARSVGETRNLAAQAPAALLCLR